jgi:hypothetical protein
VIVTNQFGPAKVSVYALGGLKAGFTAQDLAAAAAPVAQGVGAPTDEMLKIQTPGGIEPSEEPEAAPPAPKGPEPGSVPKAPGT